MMPNLMADSLPPLRFTNSPTDPTPGRPEGAVDDGGTTGAGRCEADWIRAAQQGDREAFAELVTLYWDRLHRWLLQMTRDPHKAEDLTQETFLKVLAALGSFREGTNFRAWVFRIAHNNFVNLKRSERKNVATLSEDPPGRDTAGPDDAAAEREAVVVVRKAMSELGPDFRSALLLRIDEGLSFRDIAQVMNITEETARWRVFKARRQLMKAIGAEIWSLEEAEDEKPKATKGKDKGP